MIKKIILPLSFVFILLFLINNNANSQDKWWKEKKYKNDAARQKHDLCKKTFKDIRYGFQNKNFNFIIPYLNSQVYLNVIKNEKGYYSSNQAELILVDFMDDYTVDTVKYIRSNKYNSYAYVNGTYAYIIDSRKFDLKISISLKYYSNKWYIEQIIIN